MNHLTTLSLLSLSCLAAHAAELSGSDLLRFKNNDTLHGSFLGFGKNHTLIWQTPESTKPIYFSTQKVHRIVLNRGKAHRSLTPNSSVTLINGDVIPGRIISVDNDSIALETDHLGSISLPINTVSKISPTPFAGKLLYYGPLNTDGWKILSPSSPDKKDDNPKKKKTEKKANDNQEQLTNWKFIASAWYAGTDKTRYLVRENALPDKCRLSFKLAWRGSLYCNVAIHADFNPPEYQGKDNVTNNIASIVGRAYVLSISTHSASLYSHSFSKDGKPLSTRINQSLISLALANKEEAQFELRIDRPKKLLLLYVNGDFKTKWDLGNDYAGKGNCLAFHNLRYSNTELRVSDITISQWNGLKDSAQSMKTPDHDIILLTNGLDRFSGTFNHLKNGMVSFTGSYHNTLKIPVKEIQEIQLASKRFRKLPADQDDKSVYFYIYPYGRISGTPDAGNQGKTSLHTSLLGDLSLDTRYVNIIDFSHQNSLLDLWDDNF